MLNHDGIIAARMRDLVASIIRQRKAGSAMQRWGSDGFLPDEDNGRALQDRLGKAGRVGAIVLLLTIAILAINMFFFAGESHEFAIEKAGAAQADNGSSDEVALNAPVRQETATVSVYVTGAVASPGVFELPEGSRAIDAVKAAGGMDGEAVSEAVNLARRIQDGEHIHIPREGELQQADDGLQEASDEATGCININTADAQTLENLPGIGPATASKIVADREMNGPFASLDDLTRVSGIGTKKLESLRDYACV